jgi:type VI secretion system secreted protein VgrG
MTDSNLGWYAFSSAALPDTDFQVAVIDGVETLGGTYFFDIDLAVNDPNVDMTQVVGGTAALTIKPWGTNERYFHGLVTRMEVLREVAQGQMLYRARLEPNYAKLRQNIANIAYIDGAQGLTLSDIINKVMDRQGLQSGIDYELKLSSPLTHRYFMMQFHESDFDFLQRWLEFEGAYYYFDQGQSDGSEKIVFVDDTASLSQTNISVKYRPNGAIATDQYEKTLYAFGQIQQGVSQTALLQNYNYRHSQDQVSASASHNNTSWGTVTTFGGDLRTNSQASSYAQLRAQMLGMRAQVFKGTALVSGLSPGISITVADHPRDALNTTFRVISVHHRGCQAGFGITASNAPNQSEDESFYTADFEALLPTVQFRLPLVTPRPTISGYLPGQINGESGTVAYLDEHGRYKVVLPFDTETHPNTKASAWIRLATPYNGPGQTGDTGFHFPLLQGTEVALAFLGGDPDLPIIVGALNNSVIPSPVNQNNPQINRLVSQAGHELHMDDTKDTPAIRMQSASSQVAVLIGSYGGKFGNTQSNAKGESS